MKTKEPSKCREWEKVRRDKLNKSFSTLSKLLPNHDPSSNLSKIEILQKATVYIEELQQKLKDVLTADGVEKVEREEITELYERIKKLLLRNEQLSNLLRDAGLRIPSECGSIKNFKEPLRWSNKISPEQAKEFAEKEAQKENAKEINKTKKPKLKNVIKKTTTIGTKHQRKDAFQKLRNKGKKSAVIGVKLSNITPIVTQQHLARVTSQPYFIITTNPPTSLPQNSKPNKSASTIVTNSSTLAAPKMASVIAPPPSALVPKVNSTLSSLGPGTLILANGNIVPILPPPTTVLSAPAILTKQTPILLKQPSNNATLIVMPTQTSKEIITKPIATTTSGITSSCATNVPTKTFARIRPKVGITKTTQVNKVPIPALTSRYSNLTAPPIKNVSKGNTIDHKNKQLSKKRKLLKSSSSPNDKRLKADTVTNIQTVSEKAKSNVQAVENIAENVADTHNDKQKNGSESETSCANVSVPLSNVEYEKIEQPVMETPTKETQFEETKEMQFEETKATQKEKEKSFKATETKISDHKNLKEIKDANGITSDEVSFSKSTALPDIENKPVSSSELLKEKIETTKILDESKTSDRDNQSSANFSTNNGKEKIQNDTIQKESTTTDVVVSKPTQSSDTEKNLEVAMNLNHSELSNDIFSSLQVPIGGQNPESTSPTAAFLLAFPLVSSLTGVKVTEVIEEENSESRHGTPTLLQIGTMDTTKTTQSVHTESLTPNLLNLDNFSFFSGKDLCSNFYSSFDSSANVYPVTTCSSNLLLLENPKDANCAKDVLKPTKIISEPAPPQVKQQKENLNLGTLPNNLHIAALNTSEAKTFVRQNTSVSYTKPATAYVHGSSMNNIHYDGHQKISSTTGASSLKDMNVITYSGSSRKNSDITHCTSNYNTSTSNVVSVAQCNTYNPFSDFSKSSTVHTYSTFSKPYSEPLYTNSTHYNYSQTNANNFEQSMYYSTKSKAGNVPYTTSSYSEPPYSMDCKGKRDSANQRHNSVNYYNHPKAPKEKYSSHSSKGAKPTTNQPKPPINWMTTPDFRPQPTNSEYFVPPPFAKDIEYTPNSFYSSNSTYFNSNTGMYPAEFQNDNRKPFDSSLPIISSSTGSGQRNEFEENQFSWSPTKLPQFLETPHSFVSSTLPTLVGDLALGTTQPTFTEQKVDSGPPREHITKSKDSNRRSKVHPVNYDNQTNFLSVSQLVENKTDLNSSTRGNSRRNSGNRNVKNTSHKGNKHSHKSETKELVEGVTQNFEPKLEPIEKKPNLNYSMQGVNGNANWMADCNKANRHVHKNTQSSYSAEALIGHQDQSDSSISKQRYRQQQVSYSAVNKAIPIPTFLSDNIVPYFPPVEIPQENFIQSNLNYQSSSLAHSFPTSVQNNVYTSGTYITTGATITSSYLQNSCLISEFGAHDYSATISDNTAVVSEKVVDNKNCNRNEIIKQASNNSSRTEQQINAACSINSSNNFMKKSKLKHSNENNLPGIVDFGFLSMPSTINSPILPDDFHSHSNFLPPPTPSQLYPCKNPLYPKQTSDLNSGSLLSLPSVPISRSSSQHFEGSSAASNVSSSLTSFNLSAIFPEINKGPVPLPGLYSEPSRNKSYNFQRNYLGSAVQVSFNNKSTTASSYVNSVATSYAPTN